MDLVERVETPEVRHPWELARAAFFLAELRRALRPAGPLKCLDVGCGDAWFARQLHRRLPDGTVTTGFDPALDDALVAELSHDLPALMTLANSPPPGKFDVVLCMDVMEHVEDDGDFVTGVVRDFLADGGLFVCSVPAWPALFSTHDTALKHYRRYTPAACRGRLREAGLRVVRGGGLFHGLGAVRWLQVRLERLRLRPVSSGEGVGGWGGSPAVTRLITAALGLETAASTALASCRVNLPGLSWWALCRKA